MPCIDVLIGGGGKLEVAGLTSFTERALASKGNTMRSIWSGEAFENKIRELGSGAVKKGMYEGELRDTFNNLAFGEARQLVGNESMKNAMVAQELSRTGEGMRRYGLAGGDKNRMLEFGMNSALLGTITGVSPSGWMEHHLTPDGSVIESSKGVMRIVTERGNAIKVSGLNTKLHSRDELLNSYSERISQSEQESAQYSLQAGSQLMIAGIKREGNSYRVGKEKGFTLSEGASKRLSQAMENMKSQILDKATSIKDEKGRELITRGETGARIKVGLPELVGEVIGISGNVSGGYSVITQARDGTIHTYTVSVSDKDAVNRKIGEEWTKATSQDSRKSYTESDMKTFDKMREASNTKTYSENLSKSWQLTNSLVKERSNLESRMSGMDRDLDAGFLNFYRDKRFGRTGNDDIDRANLLRAADELNIIALDKDRSNNLLKEYLNSSGFSNSSDLPSVQGPSNSPVDLKTAQESINNKGKNISREQETVSEPRGFDYKGAAKQANKGVEKHNIPEPREKNEQAEDTRRRIEDAYRNAPGNALTSLMGDTSAHDIANGKESLPPPSERIMNEASDIVKSGLPHAPTEEEQRKFNMTFGNKYWEKKGAGKQTQEQPKVFK